MLVLFRNLFSFLVGQSLIATPRVDTIFRVFLEISALLTRFEFSNLDGSTLGEIVTSSFSSYCNELELMDVRNNPQKMLEACILGERMKFFPLYQQGFTHAAGRYEDVEALPDFHMLTPPTRQRLQRASMELDNRVRTANERLEEFNFPSLFAGIGNSTMNNQAGLVRFKNWKAATSAMHKFVLQFLKSRHGSWPPKPVSKTIPAINRLVSQQLYQDMCDLYDILVDRTSLTDRTIDMTTVLNKDNAHQATADALRQVMSEFDRSSPPVAPPIPFDIPLLPSPAGKKSLKHQVMDAKRLAKEQSKKLNSGEINQYLFASYNTSSMKSTPFLTAFFDFERRQAHSKSINELADLRCGQWLIMYAVIQSLPMTAVDAPDITYKEGVPSFLCVPPRGGAPWVKDDPKAGRAWYGVAGGHGVVELPADFVTYSVEGIFRRSHCWQMATIWAREAGLDNPNEDPQVGVRNDDVAEEEDQFQQMAPHIGGSDISQPYTQPSTTMMNGLPGPTQQQQQPGMEQFNHAPYAAGGYSQYSSQHQYQHQYQYPQQHPASLTPSMVEGSIDRGYTPLPAQQFAITSSGQYQPYVQTSDGNTMASPLSRNPSAGVSAIGTPPPDE
ncbi:hypothetical protein KEM54_002907 [Ascosphaera aggregata]|nr:hypothetical protein KEM54_002907 [Ascosphaera aggregata]